MNVSVIIPVFNEEKVIGGCLGSLSKQTLECEIVVVDDGSTDNSLQIVKETSRFAPLVRRVKMYQQNHKGPGAARNLGAVKAYGEILVFVDSDMTFAPDFIEKLVRPIEEGKTKGTFTREEYVSNWNNVWARCWNYNQNLARNRRIPENYPETAPVFRAILRKDFLRVDGFTEGIGWTDDWTLARKLGFKATASAATCYHANPAAIGEVFLQARWIGKNEFLAGNIVRRMISLVRFSFPVALIVGICKSLRYQMPAFLLFKLVYDFGINTGIVDSFVTGSRNK